METGLEIFLKLRLRDFEDNENLASPFKSVNLNKIPLL